MTNDIKYSIIPSIIANKNSEALSKIEPLMPYAQIFHLDIMDGLFVPNTSLFKTSLKMFPRRYCRYAEDKGMAMARVNYDAHLMIKEPAEWIKDSFKDYIPELFIVHAESSADLGKIISMVKKNGRRIGIALNPETPIKTVKPYVNQIDKILIMTVHPGKYGSPFLPAMLKKIEEARKMDPNINIEVDGGINPKTLKKCKKAGANKFVVGSFLQNALDKKSAWEELEKAMNN